MAKTSFTSYSDKATCERGIVWVYHAQKLYWKDRDYYLDPIYLPDLHVYYYYGVIRGYINFSYPKFEEWVLSKTGLCCDGNTVTKKKSRSFGYRYRGIARPTTKYVKNVNHVKKQKDLNKTSWRAHKKFRKDKGRNWTGHHGCKCTSYDRWCVNRKHRTWAKQQIHSENWEAFGNNERKKWKYRWW